MVTSLMTNGWKTLRVPADKYEKAKAQKEENDRTWGKQIVRPDSTTEPDDGTDIRIETVEVPAGEGGVTVDDVETIVEAWMERNVERLRKGDF